MPLAGRCSHQFQARRSKQRSVADKRLLSTKKSLRRSPPQD
jgi:hypothetical protein